MSLGFLTRVAFFLRGVVDDADAAAALPLAAAAAAGGDVEGEEAPSSSSSWSWSDPLSALVAFLSSLSNIPGEQPAVLT